MHKINSSQMKLLYFVNWHWVGPTKILESKVVQKLSLEKKINKKWSLAYCIDFWHRKITLKVQFRHFLRSWRYVNLQNTAVSFESSWFLSKKIHDLTDINDSVQRSNQSASKFLLWHDLPQSPLEGTKRTNSVVYKPQSICVFLDHFSLT